MALDGIAIAYLVRELDAALTGGKIDKIHQPEPDEIILVIRKDVNRRLLLSAGAQAPRAHFTEIPKDNPMTAPLFCMVLRKHLLGGRITGITQGAGFERVINFDVEAVSEMGEICQRRLIIEIMGKHSNIILLGGGVILDSIKRVTHEMSSLREVLPGRTYTEPPAQDKINPAAAMDDMEIFTTRLLNSGDTAPKALSGGFNGISPATAKEITHRAGIDAGAMADKLENAEVTRLYNVFGTIVTDALSGKFNGELAENGKGAAVDFAPYEMTVYPKELRRGAENMSRLLEEFYGAKDHALRISQKSQDLRRLVAQNIERCVRKYDAHQRTSLEIENRDMNRLSGELLTANLYQITPGLQEVTLPNYYDENGGNITIKLDARLTAAQNAQRYFKRYNKEKRAFEALGPQMEQNAEELKYLESVMESLSKADNLAELNEIREELAETGFARRKNVKKEAKRPAQASQPVSYTSSDGFTILVGKNNRQNDELTMKTANPGDIWLHAKDIPGSHVIIRTENAGVPDSTLEEAASLAAFYSKAGASALVPVDYTLRRHVKKPAGAKPGMVIYTHQKTAFVKPSDKVSHEKHI
ncbi:MAG: NFACT family protein [Defluviitaleaceae bacterium]|nr:NFACT family protein [Defluviitaleaceae bacterium]MCL2836014.1 NFACT family protein [Defluviitaleaceae bacterium]